LPRTANPGAPGAADSAAAGKTKVKHAVRFVQHHHLGPAQIENVLFEVIDDSTGCTNKHIHALGQLFALNIVVGTPIGDPESEAGVLPQFRGITMDLDGKFTRRRKNKGTHLGGFALLRGRMTQQVIERCDQECSRLAGTGLCLPRNVAPLESQRERFFLYRRTDQKTRILNALHYPTRQIEATELNGGQVFLRHDFPA
jgi:hypothetical protein